MCVCLSVCLRLFSHNEAASERYQQLQCNKRSKTKQAILLKRRRSRSGNWHCRGPRCSTQVSISSEHARVRKMGLAAPRPPVPTRPPAYIPLPLPLAAQRNGEEWMCSPVYLLMLTVCEKLALFLQVYTEWARVP